MAQERTQEEPEVIELGAVPISSPVPSTTSEQGEPEPDRVQLGREFAEQLAETLAELTGETIPDPDQRRRYVERYGRIVPPLLALFGVDEALAGLGGVRSLPAPVRLVAGLAVMAGMIFVLHPGGLQRALGRRPAEGGPGGE